MGDAAGTLHQVSPELQDHLDTFAEALRANNRWALAEFRNLWQTWHKETGAARLSLQTLLPSFSAAYDEQLNSTLLETVLTTDSRKVFRALAKDPVWPGAQQEVSSLDLYGAFGKALASRDFLVQVRNLRNKGASWEESLALLGTASQERRQRVYSKPGPRANVEWQPADGKLAFERYCLTTPPTTIATNAASKLSSAAPRKQDPDNEQADAEPAEDEYQHDINEPTHDQVQSQGKQHLSTPQPVGAEVNDGQQQAVELRMLAQERKPQPLSPIAEEQSVAATASPSRTYDDPANIMSTPPPEDAGDGYGGVDHGAESEDDISIEFGRRAPAMDDHPRTSLADLDFELLSPASSTDMSNLSTQSLVAEPEQRSSASEQSSAALDTQAERTMSSLQVSGMQNITLRNQVAPVHQSLKRKAEFAEQAKDKRPCHDASSVHPTTCPAPTNHSPPPPTLQGCYQTLAPGRWLSATAIDLSIRLLRPHSSYAELTVKDPSYIVTEDPTKNRGRSCPESAAVCAPLNHGGRHWTLSWLDVGRRVVTLYDPWPGGDYREEAQAALLSFCTGLRDKEPGQSWEVAPVDFGLAQQDNSWDCGVYVTAAALLRCHNRPWPTRIHGAMWRRALAVLVHAALPSSDNPPQEPQQLTQIFTEIEDDILNRTARDTGLTLSLSTAQLHESDPLQNINTLDKCESHFLAKLQLLEHVLPDIAQTAATILDLAQVASKTLEKSQDEARGAQELLQAFSHCMPFASCGAAEVQEQARYRIRAAKQSLSGSSGMVESIERQVEALKALEVAMVGDLALCKKADGQLRSQLKSLRCWGRARMARVETSFWRAGVL